jgi:hypothetical protein
MAMVDVGNAETGGCVQGLFSITCEAITSFCSFGRRFCADVVDGVFLGIGTPRFQLVTRERKEKE